MQTCKQVSSYVHTHIYNEFIHYYEFHMLNDVKNRRMSDEWVYGKQMECSHSYSWKIIADVKLCAAKGVSLW